MAAIVVFFLSVFKFVWLALFGLRYSFEFFTQRPGQPSKFEYRQKKNTKIAAIYKSGSLSPHFISYRWYDDSNLAIRLTLGSTEVVEVNRYEFLPYI